MIKSMTGFGRCEAADEKRKFTVEMKGVNHRYLDANIRMPKKLNFFESAIRSLLKESVHRGKVDIFITYEDFSESQVSLKYNETLAAEYLEKFKMMEEKFGVTITEEKLREQVKLSNQNRLALRHFYELMKLDPPPMAGADLYSVLYGSSFKFERKKAIDEVNALTERIQKEYDEGNRPIPKRPRILVTGCPIGGNAMKVVKSIEANGGNVVCFENCGGAKSVDELVDENAEDIYQAIADRYLNIGCSCMTPNENRLKLMGRLLEEYKIDAVVEVILQACHTYNVETLSVRKFVNEEKHIPYINVETDYSQADIGQLNTRITAFIEML